MRLDWVRRYGRRLAAAAVLGIAGVTVGWLVTPPAAPRPDPKAPAPQVLLGKEPLELLRANASELAMGIVRKYATGTIKLQVPGGKALELPRASLGIEIDKVYLTALLSQARDPTSPMRREYAARVAAGATEPLTLPLPLLIDTGKAIQALVNVKDSLDAAPVDAHLDLSSRKLAPDTPGYRMDVYGTLARLDDAMVHASAGVEVAGEVVPATIKAADLGVVNVDAILGYFETRYNPDRKHEARTYNLRLAASKLDGHVLPPGEVFDFNKVVGARSEANGYKIAPVIAQGELVDGIGGGTCQISGTLFGAVFFSGMEPLNRTPHTRPSAYIKMGLDAAVAYPTINFRFKNTFPFPVVLHETVKDGLVRAEILGPQRTTTVTFIRHIDEVIPFQEVEREDPRLPEGARVLGQRGIPGFKLHRYRIVRDGPFAVRERWNDTYPPTNQIIRVGTATDLPKDTPLPPDDPHPEYTADELLITTQGPDSKEGDPNDGMSEFRVPGQTGVVGWTEKAGLSHWNPGHRGEDDAGDGGTDKGRAARVDRSSHKGKHQE